MLTLLISLAFAIAPTNGRDVADVIHPLVVIERAQILRERAANARCA